MSKRIYIGNLAFTSTESLVTTLFSEYGRVDSCRLITDRSTGQSKGFGFVEMANDAEADQAILKLNGQDVEGRSVKVNEAKPQSERSDKGTIIHKRPGFGGGRTRSEKGGSARFNKD